MNQISTIYLDNHATTQVDPRVLEAMLPCFQDNFGNAHSTNHPYGWRAEQGVITAREQISHYLGASHPQEIIFTSGATESNNLALFGAARANREKGTHIISSVIEHDAVLDSLHKLTQEGFTTTLLPVDETGKISIEELKKSIRPNTILISIMAANNEIGTHQPIAEIGALAKEKNILFHSDAAQGVGKMDIDVERDGVDLLSISAHKIYGPKGVGVLYVRRKNPRVALEPLMYGGGHERSLRSGTLNVPGIVGIGHAVQLLADEGAADQKRIQPMRDFLAKSLLSAFPDLLLNGHPTERLYNNLNFSVPFVAGESLIASMRGLAVSSGSACNSDENKGSYVLQAIGRDTELAQASIRFGLGRFTTQKEVDRAIEIFTEAVETLRKSSPLYQAKLVENSSPMR